MYADPARSSRLLIEKLTIVRVFVPGKYFRKFNLLLKFGHFSHSFALTQKCIVPTFRFDNLETLLSSLQFWASCRRKFLPQQSRKGD
jgi:hypothetical protein